VVAPEAKVPKKGAKKPAKAAAGQKEMLMSIVPFCPMRVRLRLKYLLPALVTEAAGGSDVHGWEQTTCFAVFGFQS
jgi:hypothetical protein